MNCNSLLFGFLLITAGTFQATSEKSVSQNVSNDFSPKKDFKNFLDAVFLFAEEKKKELYAGAFKTKKIEWEEVDTDIDWVQGIASWGYDKQQEINFYTVRFSDGDRLVVTYKDEGFKVCEIKTTYYVKGQNIPYSLSEEDELNFQIVVFLAYMYNNSSYFYLSV